jgi:cation:H+ antiporter
MLAIVYLWGLFRRGDVDGRALVPVGLVYLVFAAFVAWRLL